MDSLDSSTSTSEKSENVFRLLILSFVSFDVFEKNFLDEVKNCKQVMSVGVIKIRSKIHQNNLSGELTLNFDQ